MTEHLEQVIQQLLVPDNEVIKQATAEIKRLMKEAGVMQALCTLLATSQHAQVRQYSAILLRKLILKHKQWSSVEPSAANEIRSNLLRIAIVEKDRAARRSMIQVVATVARHDLRDDKWPELLPSIEAGARSVDVESREMAMAVLSAVAGESHSRLGKHMTAVLRLCGDILGDDSASKDVIHHTLTCLKNVVPSAGSQSLKPWQQLVVKVMVAVRRLAPVDEDAAADAMEIFDELIETEVPILRPHVQTFVQFCLEMAANQGPQRHGDKVVAKALSLVAAVIRQKKKVIVKLNLIAPILAVVFPVMCTYEEKDGKAEEDDVDELEESHAPDALAAQVVDTMALHLPPERIITALLKHVTPALDSSTPGVRRAAFVALAVSSEGCGEHLKTKYLEKFLLPRVYAGLNDPSAEVRHTVLFALGQFSEHLQPNISKHSSTLLPLLFECLRKTSDTSALRQKDITRTYYAVEMFCENLGKEIVPYLEDLLTFLLNAIESPQSSGEVKELAISAISSTAAAAKKDLAPYFPRIQATLEKFLYPTEDEAQQKIQLQALEALGILAQTLGEQFRPLTTGCMSLGLALLERTDDPDLRRCIYSLFAAVSTILQHEMEQYLPAIVPVLVERVRSVEGMSTRLKDADQELMALFADESDDEEELSEEDDEDDEDELDRVAGVDIQTPYLDEKEDACVALGTVAKSVGPLFLPYLEETYKEVLLLLEYPVSDVRKASASTLGDLCCAAGKIVKGWSGEGDGRKQQLETGLSEMLHSVVPLFIAMVKSDEEREVCMAVLEALNEMLKEMGAAVLTHALDTSAKSKGSGDAARDGPSAVMSVIREVIQRKTRCQTEEDVEELDDEEAEHDAMLIENAGDILPTLASIVGGEAFAPYFAAIVPELAKKLRKSAATSDRSFAIGVFAETLEKMGSASASFVGRLYQMFVAAIEDQDEEVRNNAVYGLGVLAANGGTESLNKYSDTLALLTRIMSSETDERVRDNVCGAVCRMIYTNPTAVPLADYLPACLSRLPLHVDIEENATVYRCIGALYESGSLPAANDGTLANLVAIAGRLLADGEVSADTRAVLIAFVTLIGQREPGVVHTVVAGAEEGVKDSLVACFPNGAS